MFLSSAIHSHTTAYLDHLHGYRFKEGGTRHKFAALLALYNFVVSQKLLKISSLLGLAAPKVSRKKSQIQTDEQTVDLFNAPDRGCSGDKRS